MSELKKTCLFNVHESLGAKMFGFSGWDMPLEYTRAITEHEYVRNVLVYSMYHIWEKLL